ncbi:MAG: DegT/DnrJ/EryC1/StrS family aminotransferase [Gemmatimonadota bacterium]
MRLVDQAHLNRGVAFKYKMSALQAAVGLAQLERIEELVARKREIFAWYREALSDFDGLRLNAEPEGTLNTYWMVTAIVDRHFGLGKRELMERLDERNIDARPFFHPLSSIPAYADTEEARVARERNVVSYEISPYGINLPSAMELTREQVAFVSDSLKEILAGKC